MGGNINRPNEPNARWRARATLVGNGCTHAGYGFGGPDVAEAIATGEQVGNCQPDIAAEHPVPLWKAIAGSETPKACSTYATPTGTATAMKSTCWALIRTFASSWHARSAS
jgi:hypothetical protein